MGDSWLQQGARRGGRTSAQQRRQFRVLRIPDEVGETLQQWAASPATLEPLLRLIRAIVLANAVHQARTTRARRVAGRARDPHYARTPEEPGELRPLRDLVDRVVADLERLIAWQFTPPIEFHELDAKLQPTGRIVSARLDENMRETFETARNTLLGVRATLHAVTARHRGRKVTLVHPFRGSTLTARGRPTPLAAARSSGCSVTNSSYSTQTGRGVRAPPDSTPVASLVRSAIPSCPRNPARVLALADKPRPGWPSHPRACHPFRS